jgi:hypothetical protein
MTLDEVLVLFNEEVKKSEETLEKHQRERQLLRIQYFGREILLDEKLKGLNWLIIMDKEMLNALKKSRDCLLREMIERYL